MSDSPHEYTVYLFNDFLESLRRHRFDIGVDHYLRLQELLDKLGGRCPPPQLKTLLCPIFATSSSEQERFYQLFDSHFGSFQAAPLLRPSQAVAGPQPQAPGKDTPPAPGRLAYLLAGVALLCAVAILFWTLILKDPSAPGGGDRAGKPGETNENLNQNGNLNQNANENLNAGNNKEDRQPGNENRNEPIATPQEVPADTDGPSRLGLLLYEYRAPLRVMAFLIPLGAFLISELISYKRRKLAREKQHDKSPPFVFLLHVGEPPPRIYDTELFYNTSRRLRRRQVREFYRLDVPATISATVKSFGYPSFRYRPDSKMPEYLILIERASFRDHQANLFNALAKALDREGLYVSRYFFDQDPRVCFDEKGESFHLVDLHSKHPEHRLLIFGECEKMFAREAGTLEPWVVAFADWRERALLTPKSPGEWGLQEFELSSMFELLPAGLIGLSALADYVEPETAVEPDTWVRASFNPPPRDLEGPEAIEQLRGYLGEETFQWLCACAVYPELQWELTLYLGSLPRMGRGVVREENLLKLARLSWFKKGAIPEGARWLLINELDPEKKRETQRAIIKLLEANPPSDKLKKTYAADAYDLNLATQQWLYDPGRKTRNRLYEVIRRLPRHQVLRDQTLVRELESSPATSAALLLPARLRSLFYSRGVAAFGMKSAARLGLALAAAAALLGALYWVTPPPPEAKILEFSASPETVGRNQEATLCYRTRYAVRVFITTNTGEDMGELGPVESNCLSVNPAQTTVYTLLATDSEGRSVTREATVSVVDASELRISRFDALTPTTAAGQGVSLCYSIVNAVSASIDNDVGSVRPGENLCVTVKPAQTTTYTLTATDGAGRTLTAQATVTMITGSGVRITEYYATPRMIVAGGQATLSYKTENAASVQIEPAVSSSYGLSDAIRVSPQQTTSYTLTATGGDGSSTSQRVVVTVTPPDEPRIISFIADPAVIELGDNTRLCYEAVNAYRVEIDNRVGRIAPQPKQCVTVSPSATTVYVLNVQGSNGQRISRQVTVTVKPRSRDNVYIESFGAREKRITQGQATDLCFSVSNAERLRIDPEPGDMKSSTSDCVRVAPKDTTTYTLTAFSSKGSLPFTSSAVTVEVLKPVRIVSFTADRTSVAANQPVTFCYEVANAERVTIISSQLVRRPQIADSFKNDKDCVTINRDQSAIYTLRAQGRDGTVVTQAITVQVSDLELEYFRADKPVITKGQEVRICYRARNAASARIEEQAVSNSPSRASYRPAINRPILQKGPETCQTFKPDRTTKYTLYITAKDGTEIQQELVVEVRVPASAS